MSKVTSLHDIFAYLTNSSLHRHLPDYYFYIIASKKMKSSRDDVIIVGEGDPHHGLSELNEYEYDHDMVRGDYSLNHVYKFDFETYKLLDDIRNVKVYDFSMCCGADKEYNGRLKYFKNGLILSAFGYDINMGNGLLQKLENIREYKKGNFKTVIKTEESINYILPYYANGIDKDFAYYPSNSNQSVIDQLKSLQVWIENKDLVNEFEFEYTKKYKAYLDDLIKYRKIFESEDYKRKASAMALFQNTEKHKK